MFTHFSGTLEIKEEYSNYNLIMKSLFLLLFLAHGNEDTLVYRESDGNFVEKDELDGDDVQGGLKMGNILKTEIFKIFLIEMFLKML